MKTSLVEFSFKNGSPSYKIFIRLKIVGDFSITFLEEDLAPLGLESEFEIKVEWDGLIGGLIKESIFIDFYFGLNNFMLTKGHLNKPGQFLTSTIVTRKGT